MKFIVASGLLLMLFACATPPFTKSLSRHPESQMQDQELFIAALDQFSATNKLELMDTFRRRYPDSSYANYAETITLYARELDARKGQLNSLQEEHQQLLAQLETTKAELETTKQENLQLNEKIEQLKALLIELEKRPQ